MYKHRIVSICLLMSLLISLMPSHVFAQESPPNESNKENQEVNTTLFLPIVQSAIASNTKNTLHNELVSIGLSEMAHLFDESTFDAEKAQYEGFDKEKIDLAIQFSSLLNEIHTQKHQSKELLNNLLIDQLNTTQFLPINRTTNNDVSYDPPILSTSFEWFSVPGRNHYKGQPFQRYVNGFDTTPSNLRGSNWFRKILRYIDYGMMAIENFGWYSQALPIESDCKLVQTTYLDYIIMTGLKTEITDRQTIRIKVYKESGFTIMGKDIPISYDVHPFFTPAFNSCSDLNP